MDALFFTLSISILAAGGVGCGGGAIPTERLVNAEASLRGAQELRAQDTPQASLHLRLAQEQIQQAKALISNGDNERAEFVLQRAKADADLALALAKESAARADAQHAADQMKSVQGGVQ